MLLAKVRSIFSKKEVVSKGKNYVFPIGDGFIFSHFSDKAPFYKALSSLTALQAYVKLNHFQGEPCHFILPSSEYRLLLLDKPSVLDRELSSAVRWLIKDLIQFPLEDAAVAAYPIPIEASGSEKVYVAVTRLSYLKTLITQMDSVGLILTSVDIPELAMRGLFASAAQKITAIAFLRRDEKIYKLVIYHAGSMVLERAIQCPLMVGQMLNGEFVSEIQRTLEYYQVQLKQLPPEKLYLSPSFVNNPIVVTELGKSLAVSIEFISAPLIPPLLADGLSSENGENFLTVIGEGLLEAFPLLLKTQGINLLSCLPSKTIVQLSARKMAQIMGVFFALLVVISFLHYRQVASLKHAVKEMQKEETQLAQTMQSFAAQIQNKQMTDTQKLEQLTQTYQQKLAMVNTLKNKAKHYFAGFSHMLDGFAKGIPANTWLTKIVLEEGGAKISLEGHAYLMDDLVNFINQLEQEKIFQTTRFNVYKWEAPKDEKTANLFIIKGNLEEGGV